VARCAASPLRVSSCNRSKFAEPGDVVNQKQRFANFGTRAPACATPLSCLHLSSVLHPRRNQIYLGGQRRGASRLSPGATSHQSTVDAGHVQIMYVLYTAVHQPPLMNSFPFQRCACFPVRETSKDDAGWPGDDGRTTLECDGETLIFLDVRPDGEVELSRPGWPCSHQRQRLRPSLYHRGILFLPWTELSAMLARDDIIPEIPPR
jgi:hypothetical protein